MPPSMRKTIRAALTATEAAEVFVQGVEASTALRVRNLERCVVRRANEPDSAEDGDQSNEPSPR